MAMRCPTKKAEPPTMKPLVSSSTSPSIPNSITPASSQPSRLRACRAANTASSPTPAPFQTVAAANGGASRPAPR